MPSKAARLTVVIVGGLSDGGFGAEVVSFMQCHDSTLDLIADGVGRTADLFGDSVGTSSPP